MTQKEFDLFCNDADDDLICFYEATGDYLLVNNTSLSVTGYTPQELIGKNHYDFFHPDDRKYIENAARYLSLQGKNNNLKPLRYRKKDGTYVWLSWDTIPLKDANEHVSSLLSISRNVQHQKGIKKDELGDSATITALGKMAGIGYWHLDMKTMTPIWSKEAYDLFELEYIYCPDLSTVVNFFDKDARDILHEALNKAIYEGRPFDVTQPLSTAKGNKKWMRTVVKATVFNGKTVAINGMFQDTTSSSSDLRRLKDSLKLLSSKNNQLEEFNNMLSHNVRSPIASLSMLLSLYEVATDDKEKQELFDALKMASSSMNELLDEMMDSVRAISNRHVDSEEMNLFEVVNQTTELLRGDIMNTHAHINLEFKGWDHLLYPRVYLESIMLNLMSNALKYKADDRQPEISIKTTMENGCKVLSFSDNGSGIDMERYGDKVFKLYRVFHRNKPGKGLGLFMIKGHVEAMGGEINIHSELDKGTTFVINFDKFKKLGVSL
jgi:PAS domain S-box-containing protein